MDYKLQEKMNEISGSDAQNMSVSPVVQIEDRVHEIAERVEQRFDTMQQSTGRMPSNEKYFKYIWLT